MIGQYKKTVLFQIPDGCMRKRWSSTNGVIAVQCSAGSFFQLTVWLQLQWSISVNSQRGFEETTLWLPNAHPEHPDWTVAGACWATRYWPRLYMPSGSGIRPEPLSRHVSSVARLCSLRTVARYPASPDGSCDNHKRNRTPARTVWSVPSVSDLPGGAENTVA